MAYAPWVSSIQNGEGNGNISISISGNISMTSGGTDQFTLSADGNSQFSAPVSFNNMVTQGNFTISGGNIILDDNSFVTTPNLGNAQFKMLGTGFFLGYNDGASSFGFMNDTGTMEGPSWGCDLTVRSVGANPYGDGGANLKLIGSGNVYIDNDDFGGYGNLVYTSVQSTYGYAQVLARDEVKIISNATNTQHVWNFKQDGTLTLPGNVWNVYYANGSAVPISGGGSYTLPTASGSTLGGVKVGNGLSIDGSGVLSANGGGSGNGTAIVNGNSNVVVAANAAVSIGANGVNNIVRVGSDGTDAFFQVAVSNITIGANAGATSQGANAVAIGLNAGFASQSQGAIAIGTQAGNTAQGAGAVAIGVTAGNSSQSNSAVAIGVNAGKTSQGANAVAIGLNTGLTTQGNSAIAIGDGTANSSQGANSIAIGTKAGNASQAANSIAIGLNAGAANTTVNSIYIGMGAGANGGSFANVIVLNSTGSNLTPAGGNGFYVSSVRNDTGNTTNSVYYNTSTDELTYGPLPSSKYTITAVGGSSYQILSTDQLVLVSTNGATAITMPTANSDVIGQSYIVKDSIGISRAAANAITIGATSGQTIDGRSNVVITGSYNSLTLVCATATSWILI